MQESSLKYTQFRTGKRIAILLSTLLALGLHLIFLTLPWFAQTPQLKSSDVLLEIQLSRRNPATTALRPVVRQEEILPPEPETEPDTETLAETLSELKTKPIEKMAEVQPEASKPELPPLTSQPSKPYISTDFDNMNDTQRRRLASSILTRQFIHEKTVTEQLFGKPLTGTLPDQVAEFYYPVKDNMISMLDQPMPDLPFTYEEGLIYFAYDPGVKGDLQRFWDVITPEFYYRTKYGTEIRCIWMLVIGACGWK